MSLWTSCLKISVDITFKDDDEGAESIDFFLLKKKTEHTESID